MAITISKSYWVIIADLRHVRGITRTQKIELHKAAKACIRANSAARHFADEASADKALARIPEADRVKHGLIVTETAYLSF